MLFQFIIQTSLYFLHEPRPSLFFFSVYARARVASLQPASLQPSNGMGSLCGWRVADLREDREAWEQIKQEDESKVTDWIGEGDQSDIQKMWGLICCTLDLKKTKKVGPLCIRASISPSLLHLVARNVSALNILFYYLQISEGCLRSQGI